MKSFKQLENSESIPFYVDEKASEMKNSALDSSIERNVSTNVDFTSEPPRIRPVHKMSVPIVSLPSNSAGRSRLSSFNLPLFNSTSRYIFSVHLKRRGSLVKALQKKASNCKNEDDAKAVLDVDDREKEKPEETTDGRLQGTESSKDDDFGPDVEILKNERSRSLICHLDEKLSQESNLDEKRPNSLYPGQLNDSLSDTVNAVNLQQTERALLTLLDEFNAGNLRAFGASDAAVALRHVREMQERLAKCHFELYALQEKIGFDNPKLSNLSFSNWRSLFDAMQELRDAIHRLSASSKSQMIDKEMVPRDTVI